MAFCLGCLSLASVIIVRALSQNLVFFYTPSELLAVSSQEGGKVRLGGVVKKGSVEKSADTLALKFVMTDDKNEILVMYQGQLPSMFREGQGIVAEGLFLPPTGFKASKIFAKHDEKYMPPEAAKGLKKTFDPQKTCAGSAG